MKVKNLNGTSQNKCNCGTWLAHWEKISKQTFDKCAIEGCDTVAEHGGHVQKVDGNDGNWYVVPLCAECNVGRKNVEFELKEGMELVSANVSQTCGVSLEERCRQVMARIDQIRRV